MTFHRPFDQPQLEKAWKMYRSMRFNLRSVRRTHPPRTMAEKQLLDLYRVSIQRFGEQLLKPLGRINPEQMNRLGDGTVDAFVFYLTAYRAAEGGA